MGKIKLWTKQHINILDTLEKHGRHIVKREYIEEKMEDIAHFYLDVYHWYSSTASKLVSKPQDVQYPIWVSLSESSVLDNDPETVLLELEVDHSKVIEVDYDKWGYIVNYMYIPYSAEDEKDHQKLLDDYGIDDPHAYMSNFYPSIKKKIIKSWDRLFDNACGKENEVRMGTIWEIRSEWISKIIR